MWEAVPVVGYLEMGSPPVSFTVHVRTRFNFLNCDFVRQFFSRPHKPTTLLPGRYPALRLLTRGADLL